MHKTREVADKIRSYELKLRLYLLPPYRPELSSDIGVWLEVKSNHVGQADVFFLAGMKSHTLGALRHLVPRSHRIRPMYHTKTILDAG